MAKDPVCGMTIDENHALRLKREGEEYFFCSAVCRDRFLRKSFFKNKLFIVLSIVAFLLLASLFIPALLPFQKVFLLYVKKIWWAVLLGLALGGIIDYYVPQEYISKVLSRKKPYTIFNAVFLGFLMSACSHGMLALSMQLHKKGASNPAVISFLLASPWANFAVTIMLVGFFGLKGLLIILAAIVVAINTGFIFMLLDKKGLIEKNRNTLEVSERFSILNDFRLRVNNYRFNMANLSASFKGIFRGATVLANMVLWWVILGILIASLAGTLIPVRFFHKFMGPTLLGLLVTLALATTIEVCSEGSSPLAFEIWRQTGALGNSFVFLMAGVVTDYTEIGLLWMNVGKRTAMWLPVIAVPQVILIGYLINIILK
ncbi:MAG: permease [Candidatus Omnitrophica bacterium]|nr:permease [Candidatus Omnitrophota bacterium]